MNETSQIRSALAVQMLRLFPPSVGEDVLEHEEFRERYGLVLDGTIEFSAPGVAMQRSKLYPAIRKLYAGKDDTVVIGTADGNHVTLSIERGDEPSLFVSTGEKCYEITSFWMFAEDASIRLASFTADIAKRNLPPEVIESWRQKISERPLSDDEVEDLLDDLKLIPQKIATSIREELHKPEVSVRTFVPRSRKYYRGLVGDRGVASTIEEYARGNVRGEVERLLRWDFKRGLAQCLLFCANPRISALVDISGKPPEEIENFYKWLANDGDRFSQIAGVEIGIRALAEYPNIEPVLVKMLEDIRDDDTSGGTSRLALTADLFVFVDGELSRTRTFADDPPYWRRLSATAQASMIERTIVTLGAAGEDFTALRSSRARQFFMQTLTDLREEPRWLPDLMNPKQLRLELLMRARIAGEEYQSSLPEGPLHSLLLGKEPNQLEAITSNPLACAPSPVEGGISSPLEFPEALLADLRAPHDDKAVEAKVFASVVNFSQTFRFDAEIAGLIVNLLRKVKYRLSFQSENDISFTLIMGLASIAASARHHELADELRILTRVLLRRKDLDADSEAQMRIALVACASREDKIEWCEAVGEWLLEIANGDFDKEEAARFRAYVRLLCHAVPELWRNTAKVDAALAAISDLAT